MKSTNALSKYLSPFTAWGLAFGFAVGWGSFVMPGSTFLPGAGPLVTDLQMPGMSGRELVAAVRADATLAKLPVFVFTADDELKDTYASMGFTGALIKPASAETIQIMLESITEEPV